MLGEHVLAEIDIERGQRLVGGDVHEVHLVGVVVLDQLVDDADIGGPGIERRDLVFDHARQPAERHVVDAAGDDEVDLLGLGEILIGFDALGDVLPGVGLDQLDHAAAEHAARLVHLVDRDLRTAKGAASGVGGERTDKADFHRPVLGQDCRSLGYQERCEKRTRRCLHHRSHGRRCSLFIIVTRRLIFLTPIET